MGRYPFVTWARRFLEDAKDDYDPTTIYRMGVNLSTLHKDVQELRGKTKRGEPDGMSTTDPEDFTPQDIHHLIGRLDARVKRSTRATYMSHLGQLLDYVECAAMRDRGVRRRLKWTGGTDGPLPCPTEPEIRACLEAIRTEAEKHEARRLRRLKPWHVGGLYLLTALGAATGGRLKECRLADRGDLTPDLTEILLRHVKGERTYGRPRRVRIVGVWRPYVKHALELQAAELRGRGIGSDPGLPLVVWFGRKGPRHWSQASVAFRKSDLKKDAGVKWTFQALRRAWGQNALDRDPGNDKTLQAVSRQLGHSSTVTTEKYYARIRVDRALRDLADVYENPEPQSRLIERKARRRRKGHVQIQVL